MEGEVREQSEADKMQVVEAMQMHQQNMNKKIN